MRSWCPERHQQGPKWTTETFDIHQQHQQPEVGTSLSLAYGPMGVAFVSTDLLRSGCSAMNCPSKSCTLLSTYSMPLKAIELFTKRKNHSAQHSLRAGRLAWREWSLHVYSIPDDQMALLGRLTAGRRGLFQLRIFEAEAKMARKEDSKAENLWNVRATPAVSNFLF